YEGGECREIYGGGFEGDVEGHTTVNLIGGKFYDAFGGACNADVSDYTEVYIGRSKAVDGTGKPLLTGSPEGANIYGGNDFGGKVKGTTQHSQSAWSFNSTTKEKEAADILTNSYVEYYHGKVDSIAGGNYGNYEYETYYNKETDGIAAQLIAQGVRPSGYEFKKPSLGSSFLNITTPNTNANDKVLYFLGGSEGASDEADNDQMQKDSYVLVDAPGLNMPTTNVYGAGAHAGLEDAENPEAASTTQVWLLRGRVKNVFGASLNEGRTHTAHVYVPVGSTIHANAIFGGADGSIVKESWETAAEFAIRETAFNAGINTIPCDAVEALIEFASDQAIIDEAIYGGNNFQRRTVYSTINISAPVKNKAVIENPLTDLCDVYGAGYGEYSWAACTTVNLLSGAQVLDVYGGGREGKVFESKSEHERMMVDHPEVFWDGHTDPAQDNKYNALNVVHSEDDWEAGTFNTNVLIEKDATVVGDAFAGGKGEDANVSASTGLTLNGGTVKGNIYGGGEAAPVRDRYKLGKFTASTNVKILGGNVTNVFGGGLDGDVGRENITEEGVEIVLSGNTNITIGKYFQENPTFYDGDPTVERSLYGGGYRGKVYGTATTTMNNGHIGYKYVEATGRYVENLDYDNDTRKLLKQNGNLFGAGYGEGATVDHTVVTLYDGTIRNSLYGGGEISAVGRGVNESTHAILDNTAAAFHAGSTHVEMYDGLVQHNVFGGGRGYAIDAYGNTTSGEIGYSDGYTFGSTDVKIHGGIIGTAEAVSEGDGNVFGGGNIGHVYAGVGIKTTDYYRDGTGKKTKDCSVIISPYCRVPYRVKILKQITDNSDLDNVVTYNVNDIIFKEKLNELILKYPTIDNTYWEAVTDYSINGTNYAPNTYVETDALNLLSGNSSDWSKLDSKGVQIGNAVFAGGNVSPGSDKIYANTVTVHGNAVASVVDVFAKDLITLGEDGIGGLYGDGNLTLVDGYRGLNITNYGTDYYNLSSTVDYTDYLLLTDRERAYFELEYETDQPHTYYYYVCKHTHTYIDPNDPTKHITYKHGQKLPRGSSDDLDALSLDYNRDNAIETSASLTAEMKTKGYWWSVGSESYDPEHPIKEDEYNLMDPVEQEERWTRKGFCRLYAGRMINTIQRADFCGVFGSRVVMRGAQDRVTNSADYTEYTINRVAEVSLNKVVDPNNPDDSDLLHGNYFGIYNVVNYLGALTSDVPFVPSGTTLPTAGSMSSDDAIRTTKNSQTGYTADGYTTFYEWKQDNLNNRKRNDGVCHNDVALASGVWLELVREPAPGSENQAKEYGPITGVVELALINVSTGEGGGYVYAKNEHGVLDYIDESGQLLISEANKYAVSYKQFHYKDPVDVVDAEEMNRQLLIPDEKGREPGAEGYINTYGVLTTDGSGKKPDDEGYVITLKKENGNYVVGHPITPKMQTSGNFINSDKRIVDDCYPLSGAYMGADASPAHYWYIRGDFYVYDQYISAYTGSSQAYAEKITIPLTITAEAQGRLTLNSVNQNLYAYWNGDLDSEAGATTDTGTPIADQYKSKVEKNAIIAGSITYHKNDPITYWEWSRLTKTEQALFIENTYSCTTPVTYNGKEYVKKDAINSDIYNTLPTDQYVVKMEFKETDNNGIITTYAKGDILTQVQRDALNSEEDKEKCISIRDCFNVSNSISHDTGFLLTLDWDNPEVWNKYYRDPSGTRVDSKAYGALPDEATQRSYTTSPTFRCNRTGLYGEGEYSYGAIIDKTTYDSEDKIRTDATTLNVTDPRVSSERAAFQVAYVAKADCETLSHDIYKQGACISRDEYNELGSDQSLFDIGYICTESYLPENSSVEYLYGTVIPQSLVGTLGLSEEEQAKHFKPAYICTTPIADGKKKWGGTLFVDGYNYPAREYSNLSAAERAYFAYNYDAFDLLSENFIPEIDDEEHPLTWYEGISHTIRNSAGNDETRIIKSGESQIPYSQEQLIDYIATYTGSTMTGTNTLNESVYVTPKDGTVPGSTPVNQLTSGDKLSNTEYEKLTNEQFKYTPIIVSGKDATDKYYYVVKTSFGIGETWYAPGNQVTEAVYESMSESDRTRYIIPVSRSSLPDLPTGDATKRYYFCTKEYPAVTPITDVRSAHTSYATGQTVPVGTIINDENWTLNDNTVKGYEGLINEQLDFSIDGKIPNTTSTLYVAREVDIDKLQEDKVVTVMYWYEYVESDADGRSYETIRERHIINVHIHFESGVPTIGTLLPPSTVLPGQKVGLNQPSVSKGAFEVIGGGWEIYTNETDATIHQNGTEYDSGKTPMYWYQDGYWLAYYAKTYLGRTYSNPVQFSVANYHRMSDVMTNTHKEEGADVHDYMYLNEALKVGKPDAKVYIGSSEELDNFKLFYDLTKGGPAGFERIGNCTGLNFFLDDEIKHTGTWTSVGDEGYCFAGNFHGDGHAITGLDNSLFNWLCGDVYNTGVAGSFTGAGIAETGDGYVANCWIKTTATPTSGAGHYPVFGNPSRDENEINEHGPVQVENCYYPKSNSYYVTYPDGYNRGKAIQKEDKAFIDGEVAYNLNSFYLNRRKADHDGGSGDTDLYYWKRADAGVEGSQPTPIYYPAGFDQYVEDRYSNVDFLYADGVIPDVGAVNKRYYATNGKYYPIYPDDYIFFGQNLTYGLVDGGGAHDEHPVAALKLRSTPEQKNNDRLLITDETGNRVYRAPGYYRSSVMNQVFFNRHAAFKSNYTTSTNGIFGSTAQTLDIHNRLTAIDFTGYHDTGAWTDGSSQDNYFRRVLDYEGLSSFTTSGVTRNLLVYADADNDVGSHYVLEKVLSDHEPIFDAFYSDEYSKVGKVDDSAVKGHLVSLISSSYISSTDQFLVDKQDFNAPIRYQFFNPLGDKRMWYQRMPDNYVGKLKNLDGTYNTQAGWEGISIPFEAELVTTDQKGEITHFYSGSENSKNDTGTKIGHEYWLRHYSDLSAADANGVRTATMRYPDAITDGDPKTVTNTFLWDYYYSENTELVDGKNNNRDENDDKYQTYYNSSRTYNEYPRLDKGKPYIIGFPGERYYEFDLSGAFKAEKTADPNPVKLEAQTISFVSKPGIFIEVSDGEMAGDMAKCVEVTESGTKTTTTYTFKPSYLNETLTNGKLEDGTIIYTLKSDGSEYELASNIGAISPVAFRPYFTRTTETTTAARPVTRSIVFSNEDSQLKGVEEKGDPNDEDPGNLSIYAKKHKIIVESALNRDIDVRIVNTAGITVSTFTLEPGEIVETRIVNAGVYIVQSADGRYTKKLAVK
ncbi:MAG: T9SS type A sorting domain-containing protein, partial [Prevotella sp.]|nr:T9SS type A sorting domain-containing protein [Prevotella sp.]